MVPSRWPAGAADEVFLDGLKRRAPHVCSSVLTRSVAKASAATNPGLCPRAITGNPCIVSSITLAATKQLLEQ